MKQFVTLTPGADTGPAFIGGAGNDTFTAAETTAKTWTVGDNIDGGGGNDTFNVTQTAAITTPVGATVKNIETANMLSGTTGTDLNTTTWTGLTALNITAPGAVTATAAATTDITITDAAQAAAAISVNGGKAVTVTGSTSVASAGIGGTVTVGATTAAAGAVTVTENVVSTNVTGGTVATGGAIAVTGGTAVTVNQNISGASVATANVTVNAVGGAVAVTGDANTTSATVSQTAAVAAVASATVGVHGIKDGAVTIKDANATSTTKAGTLTTATLKNYGDSTIDSNALTTVNLEGTGGTLGITTNSLTTAANTALALNVNGLSYANAGTSNAITVDTDVKTLNITSSTAASTVANITAAGATAVNVAGDTKLTLTNNTFAAATAITVTNTAGATFGTTAIAADTLFTGGTGADSIILSNAFTKAITMGAGDDTVTYGGAASVAVGKVGSVDAGAGKNTIKMTAAEANSTTGASSAAAFNTAFKNFSVLDVATGAATVAINLAGINGVNEVVTRGVLTGQSLVLDGFTSGGTLTLDAAAGAASANVNAIVTNAVLNPGDTFNVKLSNDTNLTVEFGKVTLAGIETVNISTMDAGKLLDVAATKDTATLVATDATKIVVSGNNGLGLVNTGNTKVTSFDASGVVANDATDTAANLGVTFASANNTTTATVTITGGDGNDVLTGNAAKDTITGGKGNDILAGGLNADIINVGIGHDVINVGSNADVTGTPFTDSGTALFDTINGFKTVGTAISTAVDFKTQAKFLAAAAGNTDLSILNITALKDDAGAGAGTALTLAVEANATGVGQGAGVSYTVKDGILTLSGTGASSVDTLGKWLLEASAVAATDGEILAFQFGANTYVFAQNGAQDVFVELAGVTAIGLVGVTAGATTTAAAGSILFGDSLA